MSGKETNAAGTGTPAAAAVPAGAVAVGTIDGRLLDRLVDGELDGRQRRALLEQLAGEPDGWRRCALAFLEAQEWRRQLRAAPAAAAAQPRRVGRGVALRVARTLSLAAGLAAALTLGALWNPLRPAGGPPDVAARSTPSPNWKMVSVELPALGGGTQRVQVPLNEAGEVADAWSPDRPAIPADVLESLRRAGHMVRRSSGMVPVQLDDGRQAVIPVDDVEVEFVGRRFQ